MNWIIEAYGLTKRFPLMARWKDLLGRRKLGPNVVDHVDLLVGKGELFGLVGPNGAGKTTLIKMLSTLIVPSSGSIRISDYDIKEEVKIKRIIGLATSDERSFYWRLTGRQNLLFFASLHNMVGRKSRMRVDEVLRQVGLQRVSDDRFHTYSTGMRQRLVIARALLTEPSVIFLDEPTKGIDPLGASQIHRLIRDHLVGDLGITVFLTSHHLREIEAICHRIAIMSKGRIQGCGTMVELRKLIGPIEKYRVEVHGLEENAASKIVEDDRQIHLSILARNHACFEFDNDHSDDRLVNLITTVRACEGKIRSVSCAPVSLDTIFEFLTSKPDVEKPPDNHVDSWPIAGTTDWPHSSLEKSSEIQVVRHSNPGINQLSLWEWIKVQARIAIALIRRDMIKETSYRLSFFMEMLQIFGTVAALFFMSRLVGQDMINKYLAPYGGDYFAFAIIGVAFFNYFTVGFCNFATQVRTEQNVGTFEAMLSTPAGISTIVLGSSLWEFVMATLKVVVLLLSGALIMNSGMRIGNFPLALLILLLTVGSASSIGIISACFIIVVKRGDPIGWLFRSASYFLGGVLFPIGVFPSWLQKLALLLPTTHALRAMRLALLQGKSMSDMFPEIGALCIFCFLVLPISLRTLKYAVWRAKQDGSLTHY
jgi:ABC-type multidrug transport system ATPase subunit/ABC-type multidrug transport system permease subunit